MPAHEFLGTSDESDAELAERFRVAVEQAAARRLELGRARAGRRRPP
jgi:hypothetical protein